MDLKEKTAEFEGEDLSQNQQSDKKPTNRPIYIPNNKLIGSKNVATEEHQFVVLKHDDIKHLEILQHSSMVFTISLTF
jgi:hypothetical protein